jgi:mono/diheme cytochrome c family protein
MTPQPPPRVFHSAYTLIVWLSAATMVAITVWITWTLIQNSPVGTQKSELYAESLPTRTALAQLVPVPVDQPLTALPSQCMACHLVNGAGGVVGPELTHVATNAGLRIESPDYGGDATTPEEYIRESLEDPTAYTVDGYGEGVMPAFGGLPSPSPAYIDQIVEYLLTLE